ncbi:ribosomal-protein-alanine N-acetyltransferase [Actinomadura spongiicola]|uniref:[Ribosomal protein bS18]-alanine N-acetyltransferase n=2 Tax=Actinomadura spongiicola TaxID=2303421 RepID=A0A372GNJ3_9ACTN|nr:ribosomal protein S18-alanine N-acetyltransferase [Actinomadura spongiicola]RFS86659.1 ribosomal-protein-alanine N-acetyltransferase [Actinomadura spongiicola]
MSSADIAAVTVLERDLFPEDAWSEEMIRGELADQPRTRHYVVAERPGGEIVGYAGLAAAGGQADVQTLGVRADLRGSGIGAALLTALLEEAVRRRSEAVFLEVRADNGAARRLYERFGFDEVGLRRRYYQPSNVDAVVMCRKLAPRPPMGFNRAE